MSKQRESQNEMIDLRGIIAEYRSKWYLFAISIIVFGVLAFLFGKTRQTQYTTKANILISQEDEKGGGMMQAFGNLGSIFGSKGDVDDEVYIVKSHSVLRDVVKDLSLNRSHYVKIAPMMKIFHYQDYPVDVLCEASIPDTLMTGLEFRVKVNDKGQVNVKTYADGLKIDQVEKATFPVTLKLPYGRFVLTPTKYYVKGEDLTTNIFFSGYNAAAEELAQDLNIFIADKKSNVITLVSKSTDPQYSRDVLNDVVVRYNQRGIDEHNLKEQKTAEFIDERLSLLTGDLDSTEKGIESFKKTQGMTDLTADVTYNLTKKGNLEQQLVNAEINVEVTRMLKDFIDDPANKYALIPSTNVTADAQQAVKAYNDLILQRINLQRDAKSNSVSLHRLDDQIDAMRLSMIESLDKSYRSAVLARNDIQLTVSRTEGELGQVPYQERIYRSIMRQQEIKEQLYLYLLQRREETSMSMANSVPKGVIVDEAYTLSETSGMSPKIYGLIGALFGLLLIPVYLYIRRSIRSKFESKEELEKITDVPMLGEVCTSRSGDHLVVKPGGSTSVAELFRLIRANLQFVLNGSDEKVILMTSTVSGEGKSFISINLASSLALLGKKVLLIGMDIRAPKLKEYLGVDSKFGLTEYLSSDDIPLEDIILHNAVMDNLDIITSGPVPPNPGELLLSKKVDKMFEKLREMYDYIIVDSAPVGMVSDTFSLSRISDATVYVCRANYTGLRDVKFFNELYNDGRLKKMSLVVNGTKASKGYGYGYGDHTDAKGHHRKK